MKIKFTLLSAILFFSIALNAQIRYLTGVLQAGQETSPVTSTASGVVIIKYNTATNLLQLYGNYRNLTATISASHIHGAAAPGSNAGVIVPLANSGGTTGTLSGSATLTEVQETDLLAGNTYANVHSTGPYAGGEIRAQLTATTDTQTEFLVARLQGAQQVPPNSSPATGMVYTLIDKSTHMLYLTGSYSGLTSPAVNAHIHRGAPNASGPVMVPLIFTATTTGTIDTAQLITTGDETDILNGNTYVNVHTAPSPSGEIRGQLTQLNQMWFFANALQGSQEFPPNLSTARGTVIVKYNSETNVLELTGDYQNLNATITGSHIHSPAGPGANANVLFALANTGGSTGTLSGTFTLTEPEEADLLAGNMYANVHSAGTYGGGEIRAQLLSTAMGATHYLTGLLDAGQSVATVPVVSPGTGAATVLLDRVTMKVFVTANFSGLTSNITATHIHAGRAGSSGSVVIPLAYSGNTSGTVTGTATIRSTFADSMINGLSYLNIHTANFGAGEIRAQLGNLVLPVKINIFNAFKDLDKIKLVWETADEGHLSHFEIQQQDVTTSRWVTRKTVTALNNGFVNRYSYDDIPLAGTGAYAYYRLKMIDKDGSYYYSQVRRINNLKAKAELMMLSNPLKNNELRFIITGIPTNKKATVSIFDYTGKLRLKTTSLTLTASSIPVGTLASGMYKLVVQVDDLIVQQSFIK